MVKLEIHPIWCSVDAIEDNDLAQTHVPIVLFFIDDLPKVYIGEMTRY